MYFQSERKKNYFYQLDNIILKEVSANPYLGLIISNDLKWTPHITNTCKKASSTLGFVRRNLQNCPKQTRITAYISLVRSTLEYGATIWDPHTQKDIDRLESIQRKAVRFVYNDFQSREPGCMTKMLSDLDLPTLQTRRRNLRLSLLYKIAEGLLPAIPPEQYLEPIRNKRKIKAKTFSDCVSKNVVQQYETRNSRAFKVPSNKGTMQYKNSFFPKTIPEWNGLANQVVTAGSLDIFKTRLPCDTN